MGLFSTINNLLQSLVSLSLFLILFLPIYLYRLVVILIAKLHLPSGSEIIDLRSAMFSPWVSALTPMGGLIAPYIFRGSVNSSILLDYFSTQIAKHSRLSSLPILYGLYTFWVPIPKKDFKLNNHILEVVSISEDKFATKPVNPAFSKNLKNGGISQSQFDTFKKLLLSQPFPKGQSPWLVYLIKNLEHDSHGRVDVVIFKWHHGLGDGLSVFKMLGEAAQPPTIPPEISFRPPTKLQEIFLSIKSLFCLLETRWPTFSKEFCNQTSIISPNASSLKKDFFLAESESLPIEWIKKIKNKNKVGFNTVVLTALSLALRSYVTEQNKLNNEKKNDKPLDVATCIVLPYPGHPDANLTNHWTWTVIPLPVFGAGQGGAMQKINEMIKNCRESAAMAFKRVPLFGRLPFLFHGEVLRLHSMAFSDFPGPTEKINAWGAEIVDMSFNINIPPGKIGIFCSSLSYDGKWKLSFCIDSAVAKTQKDADNLANLVSRYITEMVG